jgi:hypothetical protein
VRPYLLKKVNASMSELGWDPVDHFYLYLSAMPPYLLKKVNASMSELGWDPGDHFYCGTKILISGAPLPAEESQCQHE